MVIMSIIIGRSPELILQSASQQVSARYSEGGMIRLETLIELKFVNSSFVRAYPH